MPCKNFVQWMLPEYLPVQNPPETFCPGGFCMLMNLNRAGALGMDHELGPLKSPTGAFIVPLRFTNAKLSTFPLHNLSMRFPVE